MQTVNLSSLCTALAFTAVALKQGAATPDNAASTRQLAGLMEEFCQLSDGETLKPATDTEQRLRELLDEAAYALQLCLETSGLDWAAEQEAEGVARKIAGLRAKA